MSIRAFADSKRRASSDWLREWLSSLMMTMLLTHRLLQGWTHLGLIWRLWRNSFLQRLLEYLSASWKIPGGGITIFDFIVKRWLGVNGDGESGSDKGFTVKGRLFTMASALHIRVLKDSSSSWAPLLSNGADSTHGPNLAFPCLPPPLHLGKFISAGDPVTAILQQLRSDLLI